MEFLEQRNRALVVAGRITKLENRPSIVTKAELHHDIGARVLCTATTSQDADQERLAARLGGLRRVRLAGILRVQIRVTVEPIDSWPAIGKRRSAPGYRKVRGADTIWVGACSRAPSMVAPT